MKNLLIAAGILAITTGFAAAEDAPGAHFIQNWDINEDGQVSVEDAAEQRGIVFAMFDDDENDELSAEEYKMFDATREQDAKANGVGHGKGNMKRTQQGLMMAFNDVNGDGVVTKEEFVGKAAEWLAMIDRNADGVVTKDDFGPQN